jgi:hypothetical protein
MEGFKQIWQRILSTIKGKVKTDYMEVIWEQSKTITRKRRNENFWIEEKRENELVMNHSRMTGNENW